MDTSPPTGMIAIAAALEATEHPVGFATPGLLDWLEMATVEALDNLPFGLVAMDHAGIVIHYNKAEQRSAGLAPERVIGRNFFTVVAPCTNNFMVAHRFNAEREIDAVIDYVFTFRIAPVKVRLRLLKRPGCRLMYLAVERGDHALIALMANRAALTSDHQTLLEFLNLTPIGIMKFQPGGTVEMANAMAAQLLMPLAADLGGANIYRLFFDLAPDLRSKVACFQGAAGPVCDTMEIIVPGTGTVLTLGINKINSGTLMAVIQDVTRAMERDSRIRDHEQRFRAIFENIRDCAICTIGLDGRIDEWNRSLNRLGGWERADATGMPISMFFPQGPDGQSAGADLLERARQNGIAEVEGWRVRKNGSNFWGSTVATALPDHKGQAKGFVVVTRDMTDRKQIEDNLLALATTDPLTGTSNRRAGRASLEDAFGRWRRYRRRFVALMIDCDHFKAINDRWGHDGGDAALIALVALCRANIRDTDDVIRWGGEEFLLLMPETTQEAALPVAERLRKAIAAASVECNGQSISLTVSIGVAEPGKTDTFAADVISRADRALYRAKAAGRNRVVADE